MKAAVCSLLFAMFFIGCNSVESIASIKKTRLEQLVAAIPLGSSEEQARVSVRKHGWEITSDYSHAWPETRAKLAFDKVLSIDLPWRAGFPFKNLVFGYVALKDGRVVAHHVIVEPKAL